MESLGILGPDKKLTNEGKKMIFDRIRKILSEGGEAQQFPCRSGKDIPPVPPGQSLPDDIEDETKYPDFHNTILKQYESVLVSFNQTGNFSLGPPFIDPVAVAQAIKPPPGEEITDKDYVTTDADREYAAAVRELSGETEIEAATVLKGPTINNVPISGLKFSPALIAAMAGPQAPLALATILQVNPFELAQKLALPPSDPKALIKPPAPKFDLPFPPVYSDPYLALNANISLPVPAPGFTIPYPDKIEFDSWQIKLPKLFGKLLSDVASNPSLLFKLFSPNPEPCFIIDAAEEVGLFGTPEPGANTRSAVQKDLMTLTGQATAINLVNQTVGGGGPYGAVGLTANGFDMLPVQYDGIYNEAQATENYKSIAITDSENASDGEALVNWNGMLIKKSPAFRAAIREVARKLNIKATWLAAVMGRETGGSYSAIQTDKGPWDFKSKPPAIGLIQFTLHGANGAWLETKCKSLANYDDIGQLKGPVFQYFNSQYAQLGGPPKSLGELYTRCAGISPKTAWSRDDPKTKKFYYGNQKNVGTPKEGGLDANKDGKITFDEVKQEIENQYKTMVKIHGTISN